MKTREQIEARLVAIAQARTNTSDATLIRLTAAAEELLWMLGENDGSDNLPAGGGEINV